MLSFEAICWLLRIEVGGMKVPVGCKGCGELTRRECGYCDDCEYMTAERAVNRLHVSVATIYRMAQDGRLHPHRMGNGKIMAARAEVDALLEGRRYRPEHQESRPAWGDPCYPLARRPA